MKKDFSSLIFCLLFSGAFSPLFSQDEKQIATPKIVEAKMDASIQKRISLDSGMIKAIASLANDGEFITISEGKVRQIAGQKSAIEATFLVKTSVKDRVPEYARVVYQSDGQGKADVFFEGKQNVPKNNPTAPPQVGAWFKKCDDWSGWTNLGTQNGNNAWCWGNGNNACYAYYRRQRNCTKNKDSWVEYDTKTIKLNCGTCK